MVIVPTPKSCPYDGHGVELSDGTVLGQRINSGHRWCYVYVNRDVAAVYKFGLHHDNELPAIAKITEVQKLYVPELYAHGTCVTGDHTWVAMRFIRKAESIDIDLRNAKRQELRNVLDGSGLLGDFHDDNWVVEAVTLRPYLVDAVIY